MFRAINTTIILVLCLASISPAHSVDANSNKSSNSDTNNRSNESIKGIAPTSVTAKSGVVYQLFPQEKFVFDFRTKRPSKADNDIVFCIPAAFTGHDNKIDGVYISNGVIGNANAVNHELGGAMVVENGQGKLVSTNKGATLTQQFLESLQKAKGSLFQQFLIVHNGTPAIFRDQSKFQRRAIGLTKQGTFKIFESDKAITFSTFNNDLATMGVTEALYFDMGAWDEGWYRHATTGKTITIGLDRSKTNRQSNWLVLKKVKSV
jgi:hypothetical protein